MRTTTKGFLRMICTRHAVLFLASAISMGASPAAAATHGEATNGNVGYMQQRARSIAEHATRDAFEKRPTDYFVHKFPSASPRGKGEINGTWYAWRGTARRGSIYKLRTDDNGDSERVFQKRGRFSNYVEVGRRTTVRLEDGTIVRREIEATTKGRTFWRPHAKHFEKVTVETIPASSTQSVTKTIVETRQDKKGITVRTDARVLKPNGIWQNGEEWAAGATAAGAPGKSPNVNVTDIQPYNHTEYIRSLSK